MKACTLINPTGIKTARPVDKLIIHCAATPPKMDIGVKEITEWHKKQGWKTIGYHFVIRRDGTLENGRNIDEIGAHVKGQNTGSIGICLIGGVDERNIPEANFTEKQWGELKRFVMAFKAVYPKATIHGHNEYAAKACPSFNVQTWLKEENL